MCKNHPPPTCTCKRTEERVVCIYSPTSFSSQHFPGSSYHLSKPYLVLLHSQTKNIFPGFIFVWFPVCWTCLFSLDGRVESTAQGAGSPAHWQHAICVQPFINNTNDTKLANAWDKQLTQKSPCRWHHNEREKHSSPRGVIESKLFKKRNVTTQEISPAKIF